MSDSKSSPENTAVSRENSSSNNELLNDKKSATGTKSTIVTTESPDKSTTGDKTLATGRKDAIDTKQDIPKKTVTDISLIEKSPLKAKDKPRRSRRMHWGYQIVLVIALIGAFLGAMTYQTLYGRLPQPAQEVEIVEGQSYYGLLPQFQKAIPLFSNNFAKFYIKTNVNTPLKAGLYELPDNPTLVELLDALQESKQVVLVKVQIIEGKTAKDLYKVLASTPNLTLEVINEDGTPKDNLKQALGINATTPSGEFSDNLEGWFTPNTYHYGEGATDTQILTDLYTSQQAALNAAWENRDDDLPYESPYEALIMASIIEKETSVAEERELVSSVFVNRLRKGMRLQTDPTIIYGMGERYDGNIRRKDINEATAYNTYQIDGLPPTPIALPSKASIEAAMHPADSDALYFVATGNGGHKFTKNLAEHNRAVREYLKVMRDQKADK